MELPFNKGINKIIEEYRYYPREFENELCSRTIMILKDTKNYWIYTKCYINIETRKIYDNRVTYYLNAPRWTIHVKRI